MNKPWLRDFRVEQLRANPVAETIAREVELLVEMRGWGIVETSKLDRAGLPVGSPAWEIAMAILEERLGERFGWYAGGGGKWCPDEGFVRIDVPGR